MWKALTFLLLLICRAAIAADNATNLLATANASGYQNLTAGQQLAVRGLLWDRLALLGSATNSAASSLLTSASSGNYLTLTPLQLQTVELLLLDRFSKFTGGGGGSATNAQPPSPNLTNWSNIATNQVLFTNALPALTNGFVTASITNGLATTNYVNTATNNFGNTVPVNMTNAANLFVGFSPTFYGAYQYPGAVNLKDTNTTSYVNWFYASGGCWQLVMNANPVYNGIQFYTNGIISFNAGATALNGIGIIYLDTNAIRLRQNFGSGDEDVLVVSNRITYGNGSGLTNSLGNSFVDHTITNGLATTNYVLTQGTNIASALTNGLATTNLASMGGILPQYPVAQIATNAPLANSVLVSQDGTNRAWSQTPVVSSLTATGSITSGGMVAFGTNIPAPSIVANAGLGTAPTITLFGSADLHTVTVIPGSSPLSETNLWTVTFGTAFPTNTVVHIQARGRNASDYMGGVANVRGVGTNATYTAWLDGNFPLVQGTTYKFSVSLGGI
jgi:hypothetical protein